VQGKSNAGGPGLDNLNDQTRVGPVVESILDFRKGKLEDQIALVDACAPSPFTAGLAPLLGNPLDRNLSHGFLYLVLNHDGSNGYLTAKDNGMAKVKMTGYENRSFIQHSEALMTKVSKALGGSYVANPRGSVFMGQNMTSVHPLGGCNLSDSHTIGAANAKGQVYDNSGDVHKGLYVADGSAVPSSLGIHPFLTITALAESIAEQMLEDNVGGLFTTT
jgi:cholesterol oxidase